MDLDKAIAFACAGGQALHLHKIIPDPKKAPGCFVRAVRKGEDIAHLFDQDHVRLIATASRLGVRKIVVEHRGTTHQHVDLCGLPLVRAINQCVRDIRTTLDELDRRELNLKHFDIDKLESDIAEVESDDVST